jgi:hypothetical protein
MAGTVELFEITKDSLRAVLQLAVEPEQEQYVATNAPPTRARATAGSRWSRSSTRHAETESRK